MAVLSLILFISLFIALNNAQVTIYTTLATAGGPAPTPCIGAVACDGGMVAIPPNPTPGNGLSQIVPVQLFPGGMNGLSMQINGSFLGFSLELSIVDKLIGEDGATINPIFLNLMANIVNRAGKILCRVGGNSQETASVVNNLPNGTAIQKVSINGDVTFTPTLLLSPNLIYAMGNISSLLEIYWFMGVPFNNTVNPRLTLGEIAQNVLGRHLIGMQLGNEPDLYYTNGIRSPNYTVEQYNVDWGTVVQDYVNDPSIPNKNLFLAPSVCCGGVGQAGWTPEQVFDTGFLTEYQNYLAYISVQRYPQNNCNITGPTDPNTLVNSTYLNHAAIVSISQPYINTSQIAAGMNKPLIMFETNTASCGGFSSVSDSFVSALWGIDYALNMASVNFTNALFHVAGQDDYYNPFTPPSTNQSHYRQWSIAPMFYTALFVAEALGNSGNARVVDLYLNNNNNFSPGYAVYENDNPARVVLMNFLDDPTGAANYTAYISIGGNNTNTTAGTPSSVQVKYLLAPSIAEHWNISWAGQSFNGPFQSDGRLTGTEQIYTYQCDTGNNVCAVPMPAPGAAIVFLSSQALSEAAATATMTFATTTTADGAGNTATVAQVVLATSNGRGGGSWLGTGSTSFGSSSGATGSNTILGSAICLLLVMLGSAALLQ